MCFKTTYYTNTMSYSILKNHLNFVNSCMKFILHMHGQETNKTLLFCFNRNFLSYNYL